MAFKASRALMAVRAVSLPRSVPVARSLTTSVRPTAVSFRPHPLSVSLAQRYKSTERSAWAKQPVISYEELKPITQQPNDVSTCTFSDALHLRCSDTYRTFSLSMSGNRMRSPSDLSQVPSTSHYPSSKQLSTPTSTKATSKRCVPIILLTSYAAYITRRVS
jgi:hypothetical protein